MFSRSAHLYDQIYSQFKDYAAEARQIREIIGQEHPSPRTILDVACGTGEHARWLREEHGLEVDGIDLDDRFVALARGKNPGASFVTADMADFDLGKTYDVVLCLFSSVGYLKTPERVTRALERFRAHTDPQGLVIVEPWFTAEALTPGKIFVVTACSEGLDVVRMGYTRVEDRISTVRFEYLIGTHGSIEHEVEEHELGLFTVEEMKRCFDEAGLDASFREGGPMGRGLYVARPRG